METSTRKKVLWVEDDKLLGKILGDAIAVVGFDLKLALTGREAINILKDFKPDVIMVDLFLPGDMNGYDILDRVSQDSNLKGIPTIVLSNFGQDVNFGGVHPTKPTKFLLKATVSVQQITDALKEVTK